ncbi:MAG: TRAP-type C4-dicarboxylate transport system permease small subunit [Octadecabacter sp.]
MNTVDKSFEDLVAEVDPDVDEQLSKLKFTLWDIPLLLIFTALFTTVFLQFFTRYVLNDSLSWTEEAARYLLIILTFTGALKCQVLDSHIRLEFIDNLVGDYIEKLKFIALILTTFFFGVLAWSMVILAKQTSFQKMVSLPYPKYYFYAILTVALCALLVLQVKQIIWAYKELKR